MNISIKTEISKRININGTDIGSTIDSVCVYLYVCEEDGSCLRRLFSSSVSTFKYLYLRIEKVHNLEEPMYIHPFVDQSDNGIAIFVEGLNGTINIIVCIEGERSDSPYAHRIYQVDGDKFLEKIKTALELINKNA